MTPRFRTGAASHVGQIRTMNEDAFVVGETVFAVADGMGGHLAGEVASAMAIEKLRALDGRLTVDDVVDAVLEANDAILETSRNDASRRGMGTTLTAVAVVDDDDSPDGTPELAVVNLGDSRTYRFRHGRLEQVTVDHSYVQELVNGGHLTAEEARVHPQRNIVTRALGIEPAVGIDVWNVPAVRGDRFLLCSDGLVDEVPDAGIAAVLAHFADPQEAADALVLVANEAGGRDNVTVIVVDVVEGAEHETAQDDTPVAPMRVDVNDATVAADQPAAARTEMFPMIGVADPVADETPALIITPADEIAEATAGTEAAAGTEHTQSPGTPEPAESTGTTGTTEPAAAAGTEAAPTRRRRASSLLLVGVLGALAIVAGILIVVARQHSSSGPAPSTTVVTTTVPAPSTTQAPATTAAPTTSQPPSAATATTAPPVGTTVHSP